MEPPHQRPKWVKRVPRLRHWIRPPGTVFSGLWDDSCCTHAEQVVQLIDGRVLDRPLRRAERAINYASSCEVGQARQGRGIGGGSYHPPQASGAGFIAA